MTGGILPWGDSATSSSEFQLATWRLWVMDLSHGPTRPEASLTAVQSRLSMSETPSNTQFHTQWLDPGELAVIFHGVPPEELDL